MRAWILTAAGLGEGREVERMPMSGGGTTEGLTPRLRLTRVHMVTGLIFLGPAWWCLVGAANAIARGTWSDPFLLAAVHLFVVGYALTTVQGALLQITPVAFQGRLYSIRLGYIQYVLMVLGTAAFPAGFLSGRWTVAAAGGLLVLAAYGLLLWNLAQTAGTLKKRAEALVLAPVFLFLPVTVLLGLGMAVGWPPPGPANLPVHMVIGVTGWFTTLILVLSPRLMSVFVSSRYPGLRRSGPAYLLFIGAALAGAGTALTAGTAPPAGKPAAPAMAVSAAGWLLYLGAYLFVLGDLCRHFRERRRPEVEWVLKWVLAGLYGGWPVMTIWALVSGTPGGRRPLAAMLLSIFGFLQWTIAGYMAKILPFLRWMGRYGHGLVPVAARTPGQRLTGVREMMPRTSTVAALVGFAAGAVLLAWGALTARGGAALSGAVMGSAAWLLYVGGMAVMYRR